MTAATRSTPESVVIFGGSSGMGLALAETLRADDARVTIVGRSAARLAEAEEQLGKSSDLQTATADIGREEDVERVFETVGPIDHLVTTAADIRGAYQLIASLPLADTEEAINSKLLGPLLIAKHGAHQIRPGGSITFTSGIAAYRPGPKGAVVAAINGALASMARALAIELAPIRVNVVSPGWVDTPIWETIAGAETAATLDAMAKRLPAGRIGRPGDVAQATLALMQNGYITGTVLHVDGGQRLV